MRLHVGSGNVYLHGYLNVDLPSPDVFLSVERPDLVEKYGTTKADYYARHKDKAHDSLRSGPVRSENICDAFGSFAFLPARSGTCTEILARQVFEHLAPTDAVVALRECYRVLKYGGLLRLDVPDPDATLKLYRETGDEFWIRHLFGPRRNEYGGHTPYSREMLKAMADSAGFEFVAEEENIHEIYPAFCLRFQRR